MPGLVRRAGLRWIVPATGVVLGSALSGVGPPGTLEGQELKAPSRGRHPPTFEDFPRLREYQDLAISSDGRWVAFVMRPSFPAAPRAERPQLTILDLRDGERRVIHLPGPARRLRWSPSAGVLAFQAPDSGHSRVWLYSLRDSAPTASRLPMRDGLGGDVLAYAWSPPGDAVAYVAAEPGAPRGLDSVPAPSRLVLVRDTPGRRVGHATPRSHSDSTRAYLGVAHVGGAGVRILKRNITSTGAYGWDAEPSIEWSRAGGILVSGTTVVGNAVIGFTQPLYLIEPQTGALRRIEPRVRMALRPSWSPSGKWVAFLDFDYDSLTWALRITAPGVTGSGRTLLPHDPSLGWFHDPDFPLLWGADDVTLYFARYERGTARLLEINTRSGRWRVLTPDSLSVANYAVTAGGRGIVAVLESANQPPEIFRIDPRRESLVRLTDDQAGLRDMQLGRVEPVEWQSGDGRFTIRGFLVKPPAYDPARRYPLIVMVHGGPGGFYPNSFVSVNFAPSYLPPQMLAAAGYLVLLPNPRGDPSYGAEFRKALHADWGPGPFGDVNAGVSALIERGLADPAAIGIYGFSYGAYLAAYAITQTDRFAGAAINDGPMNLASSYGQSYAESPGLKRHLGGNPWSKRDVYVSQSPITGVNRVRTPVLMRFGGRTDRIREAGYLSQGLEFYAGLRDHGVPVEFVVHPDQGHSIEDWDLFKDWVRRNLRWFGYWLRREGSNPVED